MQTLEQLITLQWKTPSMIKHCLQSGKYVQIGDTFVHACNRKPTIDSTMWYDDETEGPDADFENFRQYNLRSNQVRELTLERRNTGHGTKLFISPQYYGDKTDGKLAGLRYEFEGFTGGREATEEDLRVINEAIREVAADYEKRLKTYWKRYSNKVTAQGYWANR